MAAALLVALFAYTVIGDPISGAWAQQRAIRYAEQRFPGQTFTAPKGSWYSYYFNYSVEVQSDQSPDTHFTVETRKWLWLNDYGTTDAVTNGVTARQRMEQALTDKAQRTFDALSDRSDLDGALQVELCVEPDADSSSGYAPHTEHYSDVIYLDAPMDEAILDKVPSCLTLTIFWPTAATETDVQTVLRDVKQLMEQSDLPLTYYRVTLLGSDGIVGSGVVAAKAVGSIFHQTLYANSSLCAWKNSHVALTFSNSVHFRVVTGSASKSYTRAPGMASKNGEWVAMTNWQL